MFKFSKKSSERLNNRLVHPLIKKLMNEAIKNSPLDFTIVETVRTLEQQKINISKGVSKTIKSRHISGFNKSKLCEAIDIAPYPIDWKNIKRFIELSCHIKKTAQKLGIKVEYGGDWKNFKDYPHYQLG